MSPDAEGIPVTLKIDDRATTAASGCPTPAPLTDIEFTGDRAEELRRGTYYNTATGTAVATPKLEKGDSTRSTP